MSCVCVCIFSLVLQSGWLCLFGFWVSGWIAGAVDPTAKLMGEDFGARDPYAAELESNFTDKVLGNADTEHRIFIGKLSHIFKNRMADMEISSEYNQAVDDAEIEDLIKKVGPRGGGTWMVVFVFIWSFCYRYNCES